MVDNSTDDNIIPPTEFYRRREARRRPTEGSAATSTAEKAAHDAPMLITPAALAEANAVFAFLGLNWNAAPFSVRPDEEIW